MSADFLSTSPEDKPDMKDTSVPNHIYIEIDRTLTQGEMEFFNSLLLGELKISHADVPKIQAHAILIGGYTVYAQLTLKL